MNLATNLFIVYMVYFIWSYIKIFINKNTRITHIETRKELEKLRKIPNKTIEEQKKFIDLKYPKTEPFKWTLLSILKFVLKIVIMVGIFLSVRYLWKNYIMFEFMLWQVIIISVVLPLTINKILKKYNLDNDDLSVFFK